MQSKYNSSDSSILELFGDDSEITFLITIESGIQEEHTMDAHSAIATMARESLVNLNFSEDSLRIDCDENYKLTLFYATFDGSVEHKEL